LLHARKRLRTLVVAAVAIAITGTMTPAAHAAPSTGEIEKKIETASNNLEDLNESYLKMTIDLKKTKAEEKKLADSIKPAQVKLDAAADQLQVIANSAYRTGKVGTVNVLLGDSSDMIERMAVLDQLSRQRQQEIDTFTAATKDVHERQTALKVTRDKQTAQVKELGDRKKKMQADLKKLYAMRTAAYGQAKETGSSYSGKIPSIPGSAGKAVTFAYNQIGKGYQFGAEGLDEYDCSGLTMRAWAQAGYSLPHSAAQQYSQTTRISRSELKAGDLVFYRDNAHVGLYVGDGMIIDASKPGSPVKKRTIDIMTPNGYGRVS
jgi:peptidoglycan DL-endopeptidase CwlO